jgi:transcriptional regulator with XRE-family HTH domain
MIRAVLRWGRPRGGVEDIMTTTEFAEAVGCHVTTASRYRHGHRLPGVELLERIREVLGVSHEEIMTVWGRGAEAFGAYLRKTVFDEAA